MEWLNSFLEVFTGLLQVGIFLVGVGMVGYFGLSVAKGRQLSITNIGIAFLVYMVVLLGIEHIPYQFQQAVITSMNRQAELQPELNQAVQNLTSGVSDPFIPQPTSTPYIVQTSPPVIEVLPLPTFEPTSTPVIVSTPVPTQWPPTPAITPSPSCNWQPGQAPPKPGECD